MNRANLVKIGRYLLSFLFLFSALSKLISLPFFEGMVAELVLGQNYFDYPKPYLWVQILVRLLIAGELVLGIALLQHKWFKKLVLPATLGMLVLFTIHLFYEGFKQENGFTEGNCGCFGDVLPMTNLESIWKNVVAMIIGVYVWIKYKATDHKIASWVSPVMFGLATLFTLSFGIKILKEVPSSDAKVETISTDNTDGGLINTTSKIVADTNRLDTEKSNPTTVVDADNPEKADPKTNPDPNEVTASHSDGVKDDGSTTKNDDPSDIVTETSTVDKTIATIQKYVTGTDLTKGKKLLCLFSMTCPHCQESYADLCKMKSSGKLPNMYLVNFGSAHQQRYFFKQAGDCESPHTLTEDFPSFNRMLEGKDYPRMFLVEDGKILKEWDSETYAKAKVMAYFGIEKLEEPKKDGGLDLMKGDSPW